MRDRKYIDDYARRPGASPLDPYDDKELVYIGRWWRLGRDGESGVRYRRLVALLTGGAVLFALLPGFINSPVTRLFYVLLPYIGAIISLGFMLAGAYRTLSAPEKMTRKQKDHSFVRLKLSAAACTVCLGISALCSAIYAIVSPDTAPGDLLFAALAAVGAALSAALTALQRSVGCSEL